MSADRPCVAEVLNLLLAELLAERGLRIFGEVVIRGMGTAVLMDVGGVRILIKAKKRGHRELLRKECAERLDQGFCDICAMVECVDPPLDGHSEMSVSMRDLKSELLGGRFNAGFSTYVERIGLENWLPDYEPKYGGEFHEGLDFQDLLTHLMSVYGHIVEADVITPVINGLQEAVLDFARSALSEGADAERMMRVLELKGDAEHERADRRSNEVKALATAGLILTDAMMLHEVLAKRDPRTRTLSAIKSCKNVRKALEEEWRRMIGKIKFDPVFRLALDVLPNLPSSPRVEDRLRHLLGIAQNMAASQVLLRHDLMGRVYHQLLLGNLMKYHATLYTSIPAARLLARLAVHLPSKADFSKVPPLFGGEIFRAADFACGSGTLLSAVYKEADVKYRMESEDPDPRAFHKYMLEEGLWGFDVLLHAARLTTVTLFLHNPSVAVARSRIYALPLGIHDKPRMGSIDLLEDRIVSSPHKIGKARRVEDVGVFEGESGGERLPDFHICIMNPPFARSVGGNLLFGALPREERRVLQRKLQALLREKGISGVGKAGLGAVFVFLADKYLRPEGRMALVLPRAVLSGVSWRKVRELLLDNYHLEYVISSFEGPNGWNFSENTSLSEVLMVARKLEEKDTPDDERRTIFVNLWRKPRSEAESVLLGSTLLGIYKNPKMHDITNINSTAYHLKVGGRKVGEVYSAKVNSYDLAYYQVFAQSELNRAVVLLREGHFYTPRGGIIGRIPLAPLSELIEGIGPDRSQVHRTFEVSDYHEGCAYPALWGYDSNAVRTISLRANKALSPRSEQAARQLWEGSGRLLIAEGARLSTYRVLAAITPREVLSNVWWPVRSKKVGIKDGSATGEEVEKILALWLNSTPGLLLLLSCAEVTEGPWVGIKKDALQNLPVLDLRKLDRDRIEELISLYGRFNQAEFEPIPKEFKTGEVRREIDKALLELLGVDAELEDLYDLIAVDPMITGEKHPEVA